MNHYIQALSFKSKIVWITKLLHDASYPTYLATKEKLYSHPTTSRMLRVCGLSVILVFVSLKIGMSMVLQDSYINL